VRTRADGALFGGAIAYVGGDGFSLPGRTAEARTFASHNRRGRRERRESLTNSNDSLRSLRPLRLSPLALDFRLRGTPTLSALPLASLLNCVDFSADTDSRAIESPEN
jgi:hypothetical protein